MLSAAAVGEVIAWHKYNSGTWTQDGLVGVGSNIITDIVTTGYYYDVHSDAAYNRTLGKYMLTVQTHSLGQLLIYFSIDGINWGDRVVIDETDENNFIQAYSFFAGLIDATDDSREVGNEFYIIFPRKDWPDHYNYDELYRRLITIGFETIPILARLRACDKNIFYNEFSSVQGQNHWYYQYKTANTYTNMVWDNSNNRWMGNEIHVLIADHWIHPGNDADATLKWIAPKSGSISIEGTAAHTQTGCTTDDSVEVRVLHGNIEIWSQTLGMTGSGTHNLTRLRMQQLKRKQNAQIMTASVDTTLTGNKAITRDGNFERLSNGIVYDHKTGLEWYVGSDEDTNWFEANQWLKNIEIDGGDWHLPTIAEIQTLYDKGKGTRNMSPLFKTTGYYVWSKTAVFVNAGMKSYENYNFRGRGVRAESMPTVSNKMRAFAVRSHR